jgi:serine/threonine-protein kinase
MAASTITVAFPQAAAEARRKRTTRPRRSRPATLTEGDRAGTWRVEGALGRGGMASVYAVTHTKFGKRAALKLAHKEILDKQFTADTFLREARVVNLVDHPCVPDVFATGSYDGRPYIVMERLNGQTLGQRLDNGPMSHNAALGILLELCDVLRAAHEACVVHRDLKLDNVFLLDAPCAGGYRIKLLDWGVAHVLGEEDPLRGMVAGTLTYVAPEQIRGEGLTPAADVYALAVLAYQLLFGAPPFVAREDLALIKLHMNEAPPPPRTLCPDVDPDLAALLVAMLAKDPVNRPALPEVERVLTAVRAAIAARAAAAPAVPQPQWLVPRMPPCDPLGRPALRLTAKGKKLVGATVGLLAVLSALAGWM